MHVPHTLADPYEIEPLASPPDATVALPGSKSITNRVLVTAALAAGDTVLDGVLFADDTWAMIEGLRRLGIVVDAGSSGTRALIFRSQPGANNLPSFVEVVPSAGTLRATPGLSSFVHAPKRASSSTTAARR